MEDLVNSVNSKGATSNFIDVYGSKLHYLKIGSGDPIVFIHGMPTS